MVSDDIAAVKKNRQRRLTKEERRQQLLDTALRVVREEDADRLTLAHLAVRAGVSKPVVYDHFPTRSILLIELYKWIDTERIDTFRKAMCETTLGVEDTARMLADAYIRCASNTTDEFHAIGAALAGSEEKAVVFQELLDHCVGMFVSVLRPHAGMQEEELQRRCIGLVGAGEALSAALVRKKGKQEDVIGAFAALIEGALHSA